MTGSVVLDVLCDLAHAATPNPAFQRIMAHCTPHDRLEPFFTSVARSPLATQLARENALDVFLRWNYWCAEARYLSAITTPAEPPARWGGRRLPGPGKRLGRPSKTRPGRRRLLALWCTEQEWDLLLQHLPEDTRERYHALAAVAAAGTPRITNGSGTL